MREPMVEERIIIWHDIPAGSMLRIQVRPEMAAIEGKGFVPIRKVTASSS
ncbi:MAG: hypothetical protein ABR499_12860 [Gemmatimonadaceae bacterium]